MASIHRQHGRKNWYCSFRGGDGRWHFKSTGTTDRQQALAVSHTWEKTSRMARAQKLNPDSARELIAAGVADIFLQANRENLPNSSMRAWSQSWLETKKIEAEPSTHDRYRVLMDRFLESLGSKAGRDIAQITAADILKFRNALSEKLSRASCIVALKSLRACFNAALKQGLITVNVASRVDILKTARESSRRAFTAEEIKNLLNACSRESEWKGMILFGIYTGQRLGDIARLTWNGVDLEKGEVAFVTQKTQRRMRLPLAKPLCDYLTNLDAPDDPNAPLFPKAATAKRVSQLSNQFHEIMAGCGLVAPRDKTAQKEGRSAGRDASPISFHSLRHSAVTFLKAAGVSDALARQIVGHESEAVSRLYTHLDVDDLRAAVKKLPRFK